MNIALGFSGGGYRAATFNLGVLAYLNEVAYKETTLLSQVSVLSTVSGGTITGCMYSLGIKEGKTFNEIFSEEYSFLSEVNLPVLALERLASKTGWGGGRVKSLINAIADVYDEHLFKKATFGSLLNNANPIHLKHVSFNATEFTNAVQFRFQISEEIIGAAEGEPSKGLIGNKYCIIPEDVAKEIRIADILAASSCFPGGFEPINFPSDFVIKTSSALSTLSASKPFPIGLMDGGIVDNQGVEPILLANERMKKNRQNADEPNHGEPIDLIIVSDVASPFMEAFKTSTQQPARGWRSLSFSTMFFINTLLLLGSGLLLYLGIDEKNVFKCIVATSLLTLSLVVFILASSVKSIPRKAHVPEVFLKPLGKLLRINFSVYESLIANRLNSLLKLSGEVFLKHIRRLNYREVFENDCWTNRRIMNAIYELKPNGLARIEEKSTKGKLSIDLRPSKEIQAAALKASSMGTTLWFTREELTPNSSGISMLDSLIACGQFTMCWNLLEYIGKIKTDMVNVNQSHIDLLKCEAQLHNHWKRFQKDPYWLLRSVREALQKQV